MTILGSHADGVWDQDLDALFVSPMEWESKAPAPDPTSSPHDPATEAAWGPTTGQTAPPPHDELAETPARSENAQAPLLACPFYKLNPVEHQPCSNHKIRTLRALKQHLRRYHYGYGSKMTGGCAPIIEASAVVSTSARAKLSARSKSGVPLVESWFGIWDLLFPMFGRPQTPYLDLRVDWGEASLRFAMSRVDSVTSRNPREPHMRESDWVRVVVRAMFVELISARPDSPAFLPAAQDAPSGTSRL